LLGKMFHLKMLPFLSSVSLLNKGTEGGEKYRQEQKYRADA
jgi:hypothetical protein